MPLFCRHNRFTADCPICSKGTVLEGGRSGSRRTGRSGTRTKAAKVRSGAGFSGPHVASRPQSDGERSYGVRLERVPGGVRLAEWDDTGLRRRAPVLDAADLGALLREAGRVLDERAAASLAGALSPEIGPLGPGGRGPEGKLPPEGAFGRSRGRSGDFKEELRVEGLGDGRVRIARWVLRPGAGWELQDAPPMLPAWRYAEAVADAAHQGLLSRASEAGDTARL